MDEHTNPSDHIRDEGSADGPADPRTGGTTGTTRQDRPAPPPRRLTRRSDEEVIGGVCAGLGAYFRIDPVVFRIGFVIAAFASGAGVIGYLIAWAIIPDQDGHAEIGDAATEEGVGDTPPWVWVALAVAAVIVLGGFTVQGGPSLLVAAGLVGLGILLVRRDTAQQQAQGTPAPGSPSVPVHEPAPAGSWGATAASAWPAEPSPQPPPPPRPAPEPGGHPLVRLVLGLAVVAVGAMLALQAGTAVRFLPVAWTAVPLAIIGGGLVVGAVLGGARALIGWGTMLLVALLVTLGGATLVPADSRAEAMGFGDLEERPLTAEALLDTYSVGLGSMELDLRALSAEELTDVTLTGNVGIGSVTVVVGPDVPIDARGRAGIGQVALLEEGGSGGLAPRRSVTDPPGASEALVLDLRTGIGDIAVVRG